MKINRRQFHDLIEVYDTVDNHDRQLQPERGEEAKRYGKAPHRADISLHIEFCIAAGTEDASRTVVLTDCAIKFRPQKRSMYCRYSAAVSVSGAKWTIAGEINIRRPPVTTPMAIARCVRRPPYSRAFSSSSAPSRFPIRTPAPPLTPRIRQERRLLAIEVMEFAATASLPICPMITEYRT